MTCILGLNAYHGDSSACLVKDRALNCFLRSKMDVLVMGEWVVERG